MGRPILTSVKIHLTYNFLRSDTLFSHYLSTLEEFGFEEFPATCPRCVLRINIVPD